MKVRLGKAESFHHTVQGYNSNPPLMLKLGDPKKLTQNFWKRLQRGGFRSSCNTVPLGARGVHGSFPKSLFPNWGKFI